MTNDTPTDDSVLVSLRYRRRDLGHDRHLHAYEYDAEHDTYRPKCGTLHNQHEDNLTTLSSATFLTYTHACSKCAHYIDAEPAGGASQLSIDPFGVFDHGKRETTFPALPDDPEEYTCPDCGNTYGPDGIGQHWGHPKSDCEYPVPDQHERDVLLGLWIAGASLETRGTNPVLRKTGIRNYPLEWLKHELGVWGVDVSKNQSREKQQANVEAGFGDTNAGSHQQYRLTTRACPFLHQFSDADITDFELTPLAARILFSFKGFVIDQSAVAIRHSDGEQLVTLLHKAGFTDISLYEPREGKNQWQVALSAEESRRFADWIGGDPIPGMAHRSKQLTFRKKGPQGMKPTRRVPAPGTESSSLKTKDAPDTISLEPNWQWLAVCLTELGEHDLAMKAYDQALTPAEVYGGVLDMVYAHRTELPIPAEV